MPQIPSSDDSESCIGRNSPGLRYTSPWAQRGAHHLVLADVQELALPVTATGALPSWKPTPDLLAQVFRQLPDFRP
jgi:hypothetical protein